MDKLKTFESKGDQKVKDAKNAISEARQMFNQYVEVGRMRAEYKRKNYDAYIEQGFTKEQALEIIKVENTPFDV